MLDSLSKNVLQCAHALHIVARNLERNMLNIEKSAFRKGEYVGYAAGLVWRICKDGREWVAIAQGSGLRLRMPTLALMSVALENVI